jgi:hypothetical protein
MKAIGDPQLDSADAASAHSSLDIERASRGTDTGLVFRAIIGDGQWPIAVLVSVGPLGCEAPSEIGRLRNSSRAQ